MGYDATDGGEIQCTQVAAADGAGRGTLCECVGGSNILFGRCAMYEGVEEAGGELLGAAQ